MINWTQAYRKNLKEEKRILYLTICWSYLNKTKFEGKFKKIPKFILVKNTKFLGAYQASVKNNKVINSSLLINEKVFSLKKMCFMDVLLHEMSHQYCFEVLKKPHRRHTKLWKEICRKVGAKSCG